MALLSTPIYIGQAQGEGKTYKKRSQKARALSMPHRLSVSLSFSSLPIFWVSMPSHLKDVFSCYFLDKTEGAITLSKSCIVPRALMSIASNFCWDETEPRRLHSPDTIKHIFQIFTWVQIIYRLYILFAVCHSWRHEVTCVNSA